MKLKDLKEGDKFILNRCEWACRLVSKHNVNLDGHIRCLVEVGVNKVRKILHPSCEVTKLNEDK